MRRSRRKFVSWLLLAVLSLGSLPSAGALDTHPPTADCGKHMPARDATGSGDSEQAQDNTQHLVCAVYCQFVSLPPSGLAMMRAGKLPLSPPVGATASLVTRFPENIERPPRV